jgi:hypothetical protein
MQDGEVRAPTVTFSPAVRDVVELEYANADVILDYGSGGSTGIAAQNADVTISVEIDTVWVRTMEAPLSAEGLMSKVMRTSRRLDLWGVPKSTVSDT